jgi:lipopolysaccharide/colanic/teichoic acid biosynthesis glycosyltransferase
LVLARFECQRSRRREEASAKNWRLAMTHSVTSISPARAAFVTGVQEQRRIYFACKRLLDIVGAALLLLVLGPLMLLIAILIRLETPGPSICGQQRVGLRRCRGVHQVAWKIGTFKCYTFRTEYPNPDKGLQRELMESDIRNDCEGTAELQGCDEMTLEPQCDPRVTRLGRLLRRSSLNELPQLWNVLTGCMSLVGPRPPIPSEVEMYEAWHHQRLEAKPGMTGLWQVTARSSASFDRMVDLDVQYVETQSFGLDLRILLMTPLAVLRGRGAV